MTNSDYWGSTDMVFQCLIDNNRTLAFKNAILNSVKEGDVVIDLGSGSGVLAMFAVQAGASKVYAVEMDDQVSKVLQMNIERNGYKDKIVLLKADATKVVPPEKIDVAIAEMVATGLIDELQIPVMNNIHKHLKPGSRVIPFVIQNFVELSYVDNNFYGYSIDTIQYEYEWDSRKRPTAMSNKYMYKSIDFTSLNDGIVDEKFSLKIERDGQVNALRFSNKTFFPDGSSIEGTSAYCMPLLLPIPKEDVKAGENFSLMIQYTMCNGMDALNFTVEKEPTN